MPLYNRQPSAAQRGRADVDRIDRGGYERGFVGGKEQRRERDVLWRADATPRSASIRTAAASIPPPLR